MSEIRVNNCTFAVHPSSRSLIVGSAIHADANEDSTVSPSSGPICRTMNRCMIKSFNRALLTGEGSSRVPSTTTDDSHL
jgi:hypothetical protein